MRGSCLVLCYGYKITSSPHLHTPPSLPSVAGDHKSIIRQLNWSLDGTRLLSLSDNGVVHIWRMKVATLHS